jgi:hypothetical protein
MTKETKVDLAKAMANFGLRKPEELLTGDARVKRMEQISSIMDRIRVEYNRDMAAANFSGTAGKPDVIDQLIGRYTFHAKNGKYEQFLDRKNAMKDITMDYEFETLTAKIVKASDDAPQRMIIEPKKRHINLKDFDKYAGGVAYNDQWYNHVERLNCHMTARKSYLLLGTFGNVIRKFKQSEQASSYFDGQSWKEFVKDCEDGKAWSSDELIKEIQRTYDAIYGPGVVKATEAHANFLEIASGGGGNSPIRVKQVTSTKLVEYIMGAARESLDDSVKFELVYKTKKDVSEKTDNKTESNVTVSKEDYEEFKKFMEAKNLKSQEK